MAKLSLNLSIRCHASQCHCAHGTESLVKFVPAILARPEPTGLLSPASCSRLAGPKTVTYPTRLWFESDRPMNQGGLRAGRSAV
jgi:hypothetical protein